MTEYATLADQHRPDPEGLAAEARRLLACGLTSADVAHALRMPLTAVESVRQSPGYQIQTLRAGND